MNDLEHRKTSFYDASKLPMKDRAHCPRTCCSGENKFENKASDGVSDHMEDVLSERYLNLIKLAVTRGYDEVHYDVIPQNSRTFVKRLRYSAYAVCQKLLRAYHLAL